MRAFLSANEFSQIIKRDPKTVISWIKQGHIPGAKRVGHIYQIPAKEIGVYQTVSQYPPKKWQK